MCILHSVFLETYFLSYGSRRKLLRKFASPHLLPSNPFMADLNSTTKIYFKHHLMKQ